MSHLPQTINMFLKLKVSSYSPLPQNMHIQTRGPKLLEESPHKRKTCAVLQVSKDRLFLSNSFKVFEDPDIKCIMFSQGRKLSWGSRAKQIHITLETSGLARTPVASHPKIVVNVNRIVVLHVPWIKNFYKLS